MPSESHPYKLTPQNLFDIIQCKFIIIHCEISNNVNDRVRRTLNIITNPKSFLHKTNKHGLIKNKH